MQILRIPRLLLAAGLTVTFATHLCACGKSGANTGTAQNSVTNTGPVLTPPAKCDVPPEGLPVDTSGATNIVGNGTPASCTAQALQAAVDKGGVVKFNCGPNPVTITLTQPIVINNVAGPDGLGDTVIDGGSLVTLSGGGTSRIIYLNACQQPFNNPRCDIFPHPALTVQNLTFVNGHDDGADGGGAIYRLGGALTVIHSRFFNNQCASSGQDTAGGALRLIQPTPALIVDSVFGGPGQGNKCSNGGAIGSLQATPVKIINSLIDSNSATGSGGNPGNGGNGGGIYHDGVSLDLEMCGVTLANNTGNAFGGGLFYVDNYGQGTLGITNTVIWNNSVPAHSGQPSFGGAAYIQGANATVTNTTVIGNSASYAPGLYANTQNGQGAFNATNLTLAYTPGIALTLDGGIGGTLLNSTIAGNLTGISGAGGLTLTNSLIANVTANCVGGMPSSGGGNFQFADQSCGNIPVANPQLGSPAGNGGPTQIPTMAPGAGSPALNAGNGCPSMDARGVARPANGCTSGAHQAS